MKGTVLVQKYQGIQNALTNKRLSILYPEVYVHRFIIVSWVGSPQALHWGEKKIN